MSSRKKLCTGLNLWKSIHCAKTEKAHGFNISNKLQSFTVNNTKRRFQNITHASHREQQKSTLESKSLRIINEPTIYALSTPPGRAAIAIIRISGQACMTVSRVVTDSGTNINCLTDLS